MSTTTVETEGGAQPSIWDNAITSTSNGSVYFDCPVCGQGMGMAGQGDDPNDDWETIQQFNDDVDRHIKQCSARPVPDDSSAEADTEADTEAPRPPAVAEQVVIPLAVYSEPWGQQPGTVVVCAACPGRSWFPRSKHGTQLLQEAIDKHIGHTRQDKTHD